jgi:hypothetical protein
MKIVISFLLFLGISFYIYLKYKNIQEGLPGCDPPPPATDAAAADAAATAATAAASTTLAEKNAKAKLIIDDIIYLGNEKTKLLKDLNKEGDEGGGGGGGGDEGACDDGACDIGEAPKCSKFKRDSGVRCN